MTSLTKLEAADNAVTQVPAWLPVLTLLKTLDLSRNRLMHLPDHLAMCTCVTALDLHDNYLESIPHCIAGVDAVACTSPPTARALSLSLRVCIRSLLARVHATRGLRTRRRHTFVF